MQFCTLASGSSGNCAVLRCGETVLLIDAGISARRITTGLRALGIDPARVTGILMTHSHSDHTAGLKTLLKQLDLPVYGPEECIFDLWNKLPGARLHYFLPGERFYLGEVLVETVRTPHDTTVSVGYRFTGGDRRAAVVTDLGCVPEEVAQFVQGVDLLLLESNHDVDLLRSGPYPVPLKQRVLSDHGHLSNECCAETVCRAVRAGTRKVLLGHLSQENNLPRLAYDATARALEAAGYTPGETVLLRVAPRCEVGEVIEL